MSLDLRQLAVNREAPPATMRRRRPWISRYALPAAVLVAFLAVLGWAARDQFVTSKPVTVVPVLATRAAVQQEGAVLFTAAGWVEPRPTEVRVPALSEGVVEKLLVVEDQEVKAGQPLAMLIRRDAELALAEAKATHELAESELASANAALEAARTNLEKPLALRAMLAEAEGMWAKTQTELANLPFQRQAADARVQIAKLDLEGKLAAGDGVALRSTQRAQSEHASAVAAAEELKARETNLRRESDAQAAKRDALKLQLELLTEEKRKVAEAQAQVRAANARVRQAAVTVETADLRLERMTVRATVDGRVLSLVAQPGTPLQAGMRSIETATDPGGTHYASTVVTLYDPKRLQVRADVRLENVPQVQPGQKVRIETAAHPKPLEGEVLFATALTNIGKNTLQVKVSIADPPSTLKPGMLSDLAFLSPPSAEKTAGESKQLRLFIPRALVISTPEGAAIWVADQAAGAARRRNVTLGRSASGDLIEITAGLTAADKLIAGGREDLAEGDRITVTGEDATMTTSAPQPPSDEPHNNHTTSTTQS
jgi:multidrug efflux pump subunit AcrA (membrane-fusion protein)